MNKLARCSALAAAIPVLSGCYTYVPAEPEAVPAGREVRISLSREARTALPEEILAGGPFLRGRLVGRDDDSLMLYIPVVVRQEGTLAAAIGQNVRVPASEVVELQRRELDGFRTGLVVAGVVGAATGIVLLIMDASGSPLSGPQQTPELVRVPVFSVPVR